MITIPLEELPGSVQKKLERLQQGEVARIVKGGSQVAEIRRTPSPPTGPRPIGLAKGQFELPESFFDPLPEEILRDFEGNS